MALDGIVISSMVYELSEKLIGGRINKIYQPEKDEICIVVKNNKENYRLLISADASLPLIHITDVQKENPMAAPTFCMLLRKHIGNGRLIGITQPELERIIEISIEHLDELGDLCVKKLIVEIMGKHSNIIFVNEEGVILDSIKHVSYQVSSVREVLPGRKYERPPVHDKISALELDSNYFVNRILSKADTVAKSIYTSLNGFSPIMAFEIAYRAGVDGGKINSELSINEKEELLNSIKEVIEDINKNKFVPCIIYNGLEPVEFSAMYLNMYKDLEIKRFESISLVLQEYYKEKSVAIRVKQRSTNLRKVVSNAIERTSKKYDLQLKQIKDTLKRDKYKIYGELINVYGYGISPGSKELICDNYYTNEEIIIPLNDDLSPIENANKYYAKYNKLKRTHEALSVHIKDTKDELEHLLSVQNSLELTLVESDLKEVNEELITCGYIKAKNGKKNDKRISKSKPLHFISSDGLHIYVGKNNFQNEDLTFKFATGNDMWFHAKQMPGSHVIVKRTSQENIPDKTFEEAARLAAYYSSGRANPKVEIDYTEKRNIKKPPKSKPGFVIYNTNFSMIIEPNINEIEQVKT